MGIGMSATLVMIDLSVGKYMIPDHRAVRFLCVGAIIGCASGRILMVPPNQSVVIRDPEILSGEPVFRGTRVPFQALLDYLEGGETIDEFLIDFPAVSRDSAVAALEEAKALLIARFVT
jgi:uncharacterized protein (DUF433 family)